MNQIDTLLKNELVLNKKILDYTYKNGMDLHIMDLYFELINTLLHLHKLDMANMVLKKVKKKCNVDKILYIEYLKYKSVLQIKEEKYNESIKNLNELKYLIL